MGSDRQKQTPAAHTPATPTPHFLQTRPFDPQTSSALDNDLEQTSEPQKQTEPSEKFSLSKAPLFPSGTKLPSPPIGQNCVQAKLTMGQPGDPYEQEADQMATQVVQKMNLLKSSPPDSKIQRQEVKEDEESIQLKPMVQRQEQGAVSTEIEASIQAAKGSGLSLNDDIRQPMEQAFGADFSGVKIHTDAQSDQLNRSIQAKAFTTGKDVFFRQGAYDPGSQGGQELLAHELTHVVQQGGASIQRHATKTSAQIDETSPVQISRMPSETIQRQLMPYDFWKSQTYSKVNPRGEQLKRVDKALESYIHSKDYLERSLNNKGHKKQHALILANLSSAINWYIESDEDTLAGSSRRDTAKILKAQFDEEPDATINDYGDYEIDLSKQGLQLDVMTPAKFLEITAEGSFTGKSSFQDSIATKLIQFHTMVSGGKLELVIPLLYEMKTDAEYWQVRYSQKTSAKQENRVKRAEGMQQFLAHVNQQISKAEGVLGKEIAAGMAKTPDSTVEEQEKAVGNAVKARVQQMRQSYVGCADSMFARIGGFLVEQLAGEAGAKAELDTEIKIPVDPSGIGFIGGHFNLKVEAEKSSTKIRGELGITGGAKVPHLAEVKAELGGYMEATAQNAEQAMKLISYAFYRRIRESRVIPRELGSYIWGGSSDTVGYKRSEAWAGNVEKEIFGGQDGDDASVESGGYGALSAEAGDEEALHGGMKIKGNAGKKYTKKSVKAAKGELGKTQEESSTRFSKQKDLGESTKGVELSGELSGGLFNGDFSAGVQWVGEGDAKECAWTVEANAILNIPAGNGVGKIAGSAIDAAIAKVTDYLRTKHKLNKAEQWIGAGDLASLLGPALATKEHINNSKMTPEQLAEANRAAEEATVQSASGGGCTFVIEGKNGTVERVQLNLDKASSKTVDLEVFKVKLKQRKRYIGLLWKGGWSIV